MYRKAKDHTVQYSTAQNKTSQNKKKTKTIKKSRHIHDEDKCRTKKYFQEMKTNQ